MAAVGQAPNLIREEALWAAGCHRVAGVDEAGRGALAGPVVAAAVVLPQDASLAGIWAQVRDSKLLTSLRRARLEADVRKQAASCAIGVASAVEVDSYGVAHATRMAMSRAVAGLDPGPCHLLIDWVRLPEIDLPQSSWAKADRYSVSVAAASILAKVYRDQLLVDIGLQYPEYGFASHKGYGSARHLAALAVHGPCAEHRLSFTPVANCLSAVNPNGTLFDIESIGGKDDRS